MLHEKGLKSSITKKRVQQLNNLGFQWATKETCSYASQVPDVAPSLSNACLEGYLNQFRLRGIAALVKDGPVESAIDEELCQLFPSTCQQYPLSRDFGFEQSLLTALNWSQVP